VTLVVVLEAIFKFKPLLHAVQTLKLEQEAQLLGHAEQVFGPE